VKPRAGAAPTWAATSTTSNEKGAAMSSVVMSIHSPAEARPAKLPATETGREDREYKTAGAWAAPSEPTDGQRLDLPICPCACALCGVQYRAAFRRIPRG
jgi:hypothetical protein